jgi:hypothetical protein
MYRLRAGAGRRSGSGWRQGRVRWGRPLLNRPRGAVGSGAAAVESAAVSVVARYRACVGALAGWDGCMRFVGVIRMPVCARASRLCPVWCVSRVLEVTQTHIHIHTHIHTGSRGVSYHFWG